MLNTKRKKRIKKVLKSFSNISKSLICLSRHTFVHTNKYLFFPYRQRENKKGQLEVTLLYTSSEDGLNDVIQLTINRLRCSVQTMQEQEQFKGEIFYIVFRIIEKGE